jgi:hypothetical protein
MNKIYSCVSKDSVINLCSLNGFVVTRPGDLLIFFSAEKFNALTSVSLVTLYELSVSLHESNKFFKVRFGNRLRLAVNLKFRVNILDVCLSRFLGDKQLFGNLCIGFPFRNKL